jgi:hypothetical protein
MTLEHDHANACQMFSLARRCGDEAGAQLWWERATRLGLALDVQRAAAERVEVHERGVS